MKKQTLILIITLGVFVVLALFTKGSFFLSPENISGLRGGNDYGLQTGDLVFQTSTSSQSEAIQLATNSPYSHMGIVFEMSGRIWVFEAVQPVEAIPLRDWINRGKDRKFVAKRLKKAETLLDKTGKVRLQLEAEKHVGKDYDLLFSWTDEQMYCSELVWKMYRDALGIEVGELQSLRDFDLSHPKVQSTLKARYGKEIPLEDTVISPAAVFDSKLLELVEIKD